MSWSGGLHSEMLLPYIGLSFFLSIDLVILIIWSVIVIDKHRINTIAQIKGWPLIKQICSRYPKPIPHHIHFFSARYHVLNYATREELKRCLWIFTLIDSSKDIPMTVKKPAVPNHNKNCQTNMALLAKCIELFNENPDYVPTDESLIMWCNAVVICLSKVEVPTDGIQLADLYSQVLLTQRFLKGLTDGFKNSQFKEDLMHSVISTFYGIISNPIEEASPIGTVILSLVTEKRKLWAFCRENEIREISRNDATIGDVIACERAVFSTFCRWLWQTPWISHTIILGEWVMFCVQRLQASRRFEILIDVSLECLEMLFLRLDYGVFRESTFPVVYHMLVSMRDTNEVFDKICRVAPQVIERMASDRMYAENHLNPLLNILNYIVKNNKETAHEVKKQEYVLLEQFLETFDFVPNNEVPKTLTWQSDLDDDMRGYKAGLTNQFNNCYMNSVLQALLMTKQFSTDIVLNQLKPSPVIISYLATFFSHMMYPRTRSLNPSRLMEVIQPPGFLRGQQQDSSEFLNFLLEELHSTESLACAVNHDRPTSADNNTQVPEKFIIAAAAASSGFDSAKEVTSKDFSNTTALENKSTADNISTPSTSSFQMLSEPHCSSTSSDQSAECSSSQETAAPMETNQIVTSDPEIPEVSSTTEEPTTSGHSSGVSPRRSYRVRDKIEADNQCGPSKRRRLNDEVSSRYNSIVQRSFGGVTASVVQCLECTNQSTRLDSFRDLQLAFPDKSLGITRVQDFLDFYWSPEKMFGDNKYHCVHCSKLCNAVRRSYVREPPNNLILVLKNFKFDAKLRKQTKILQPVYIDDAIVLPVLQDGTIEYELYAAVVHSGHSTDNGHYYTVACDGSEWYKYDDESVTVYEKSNLNTLKPPFTPYILFYRLVDQELHHFPKQNDIPIHIRKYMPHPRK